MWILNEFQSYSDEKSYGTKWNKQTAGWLIQISVKELNNCQPNSANEFNTYLVNISRNIQDRTKYNYVNSLKFYDFLCRTSPRIT